MEEGMSRFDSRKGSEVHDRKRISRQILNLYNSVVSHALNLNPQSPEARRETYEKQGEDEFKILGLGTQGAERLHQYLEKERYVLSFDGTITDEYFELKDDSAPLRLGDWPRIRHRVGKRQNKETGDLEDVNEFVFTLKSVEHGPGDRTEHANLVFKASDYGTGESGVHAAHEAAIVAMRSFVSKIFPEFKGEDLVLWGVWEKHRTSHMGEFVKDADGKVYSIKEDSDTLKSHTVIFQEDSIISDEERMKLIVLYEREGLTPPRELFKKGDVKVKKGYRLKVPLASIPTYAEFEVTYPSVNESDSEEVKASKEKITGDLKAKRNTLVQDLRDSGIIDPSLGITRGNLDVVLGHYNVPDLGIKRASREVLKRGKNK